MLPSKFHDILAFPQDEQALWKSACDEELSSLRKHSTWNLVPAPPDRRKIGCTWVFRIKHNADGTINRRKAGLCAQGFSQQPGLDYSVTYAPTGRLNSLRVFLTLSASADLEIHQIDVITAFLIPDLDTEIYMRQPPGFRDTEHPDYVCLLKKTLYGLKQSPHLWNIEMNTCLVKLGFTPNPVDPCLYYRNEPNSTFSMIFLWVDDCILSCPNMAIMLALKLAISNSFAIKDLGPLQFCLGLQIIRDRPNRLLTLHQSHYVDTILNHSNMASCSPCLTPQNASVSLTPTAGSPISNSTPFRAVVGSLLYLSCCSRPDISTAVGELCRFSANPGPQHWTAVKQVLRYLQGTRSTGIQLGGNLTLIGWSDANWGGDIHTRRSATGYIFKLGLGPVSWNSKRQPTVALSSCEAEYMALSAATQEALWLRSLLQGLGLQQRATLIYEDNQGAIELTKNFKNHSRTKHIDIRYHFVKERVQLGKIEYCHTSQMIADLSSRTLSVNSE